MKIGMAVFSGTGNTDHVSRLLAKELEGLGATVELQRINSTIFCAGDPETTHFNPADHDLTGIGHPILGFGATPIVMRFAEALPPGRGRMFVFKSAGDNHRINHSASEDLIRILDHKGYEVIHDFLYVMPCNWIMTYQRSLNLQIIDKAEEKAAQHARELTAGTRRRMPVYRGWRWAAHLTHQLENNYGRKQFGRALRVNKDCTLCGKCVRDCPALNIRMENQVVRFGGNCLWCMRCVYSCPDRAIEAPGLNFCILKEGYRLEDYLGATDPDRTFITSKSRGYWKHCWEYFES